MSAAPAHPENPFAGQGSVLLDIGDGVGALVVTMPAEMEGVEVEIRPTKGRHRHQRSHSHDHPQHQGHRHHPHVAVVIRPTAAGHVPSLVFPQVEEGSYELYLKDTDDVRLHVSVFGGSVTSVPWPAEVGSGRRGRVIDEASYGGP